MHRLLKRQLQRIYGVGFDEESLSEEERKLISLVSKTYKEYDKEAEFIEHSLNIYVEELEIAKDIAEKANSSKAAFLTNMSHEIRTPLHGILSFAEYGLEKGEDAPREKLILYFDAIAKSGSRLLTLVSDLLDLSRLEVDRMPFNFKMNNMAEVTKEGDNAAEELCNQKSISLVTEVDTENTLAWFDENRILQVINNLLSNAIKFSNQNSTITIKISDSEILLKRDDGTNQLISALAVSVIDEGIGIPEEELGLVFEKFRQSTLTTTGAGGTGLGLAICDEIIRKHYGSISVQNNETAGCCFTFKVPRQKTVRQQY